MDHGQAIQFLRAISYAPTSGFKGIVQVNDYMETVAAVGFDNWTMNSVQLHVWIPRPKELVRTFICEVFSYTFVTARKGLVVGLTPSNNAAALHFNKKIGFKEVYRMRDAWDVGVDIVAQEMRKENCRWLRRSKIHELVLEEAQEDH